MHIASKRLTALVCSVALAACGTAQQHRPLAAADFLSSQAEPAKPGAASRFIFLSPAETAELSQKLPNLLTCVGIWNLPSRQDMPQLVNYAEAVAAPDRVTMALLREVRTSLFRLDTAARADLETTKSFDEAVRNRPNITSTLQEVLPLPPNAAGSPFASMFRGFGLSILSGLCDQTLSSSFGKQVLEVVGTWRAFREHVQGKASSNQSWARSAYVIASAPSLESVERQLAEARSRSDAVSAAVALGLLGALVIGLAASSSPATGQAESFSENDVIACEPGWGGVWVVLLSGKRVFFPIERKPSYCR